MLGVDVPDIVMEMEQKRDDVSMEMEQKRNDVIPMNIEQEQQQIQPIQFVHAGGLSLPMLSIPSQVSLPALPQLQLNVPSLPNINIGAEYNHSQQQRPQYVYRYDPMGYNQQLQSSRYDPMNLYQ